MGVALDPLSAVKIGLSRTIAPTLPRALAAAAAVFVRALINSPLFAATIAITLIIARSTSGMSQAMNFTPLS
jgi:hypothetical protein